VSLGQSWWESHLTRFGIVGSTDDIIIPAFVDIARLKSLWFSLDASDARDGMFEKIDHITLERRPSQYARGKRSEATRPSLKGGRKIEAVSVAQEGSCH
jgi:hypothetical protein